MDLNSFVSTYKGVSIAQPSESAEICDFFENSAMKGSTIELTYLRGPDFFALLKAHSDRFFVFLLRDDKKEILGAGSVVIRKAMHREEVVDVGYLGDLRITKPRQSARIWREFYLSLLKNSKDIHELSSIKFFYTCILDDNKKAQKALETRSPLGYHLMDEYEMVNVFRQKPFQTFDQGLEIERNIDEKELVSFLQKNASSNALGFPFNLDHHEWEWRKNNWPQFERLPRLGVYQKGRLIAFTKLWSPTQVKKIRLDSLPPLLGWGLKFLSFLTPLPQAGGELKVCYMTLLCFEKNLSDKERQEAMRLLISQSLVRAKRDGFHCLSFANFKSFSHTQSLSSYLNQQTPLRFYLVDPLSDPLKEFSATDYPPCFEMGLV